VSLSLCLNVGLM